MKILTGLVLVGGMALAGTAFAQTTSPGGATKMSQSDCTARWASLDSAKSGSITESQAHGVLTNFNSADANKDGKLSQSEFMTACSSGLVTGTGSRGMTGTDPGSSSTTPKK